MRYKTDQENFWAADFGDAYIERNKNFQSNIPFFSKVISRTLGITSVIEFGCNIGLNLKAINALLPNCGLTGVEINQKAANQLSNWGKVNVINESIFDYQAS